MELEKGKYFTALTGDGNLDRKPVNSLLAELETHLSVESVPSELLRQTGSQAKITDELTRLPVFVARELGRLSSPIPRIKETADHRNRRDSLFEKDPVSNARSASPHQ